MTFIGKADSNRENKGTKYDRLKNVLREFKYVPPTGHGRVVFEIDFFDHDIKLVTPTTEIEPDDHEINNVRISTKNNPKEEKNGTA